MLDFRGRISGFMPLQTPSGRASAGFATAALALHWVLVLRFLAVRAGELSFLRLHYSVAFGVDWVDSWWYVFTFPLMGLLSYVINLRLADSLARIRPALGTLLLFSTALLQVLFAAGGSFALLLNS